MKTTIIGLYISDRVKNAANIQKILTEYGCHIKTRLGIHESHEDVCSSRGLVLLEVVGAENKIKDMIKLLKEVSGTQVQVMTFDK